MADFIGQRLGNYDITALLGEGGMASVYRARQITIGRDVAVKIIESRLSRAPDFLKRFEREARTVADLNHAHILKVFDFGQQDDAIYLVMELLRGGSLADELCKGPFSLERTARVLEQIASALDYAHRKGIIHRDLKPQNVLFDEAGDAHLTDFGIAKVITETTALTLSGVSMGTPAYMSPEQCRGPVIDGRSDVYSLGVMLFEMLTGRVPFLGDTPVNMLYMHLHEPPPAIRTIRPELPEAVEAVIAKALEKSPDNRFSTPGDLATAFSRAIQSGAAAAQEAHPPAPERVDYTAPRPISAPLALGTEEEKPIPARRPNAGLLVLGAAGLVGVLGLLLLGVLRPGGTIAPTGTPTPTDIPVVVILPTDAPTETTAPPTATSIASLAAVAPTQPFTETPMPTMTSTETPSSTPTPTASATETSSATPTSTGTATPSDTPTATLDAKIAVRQTLDAASTLAATSWTATPTPDVQGTIDAQMTAAFQTVAFQQTQFAQATGTSIAIAIASFTATPTATWTATATVTPSATSIPSMTPSHTPSSKPSRTPTSVPTSTPRPTQASQVQVVVNAETVNLRSGPGTEYERVGSVVENQRLTVLARDTDSSWYLVRAPNGQTAWIAADLVQLTSNVRIDRAATIPARPARQAPRILGIVSRGNINSNIYRWEISYSDEQGDAREAHYDVISTTNDSVYLNDGVLNDGPSTQKQGGTFYFDFTCGSPTVTVVGVTLIDLAGNRSERMSFTVTCP